MPRAARTHCIMSPAQTSYRPHPHPTTMDVESQPTAEGSAPAGDEVSQPTAEGSAAAGDGWSTSTSSIDDDAPANPSGTRAHSSVVKFVGGAGGSAPAMASSSGGSVPPTSLGGSAPAPGVASSSGGPAPAASVGGSAPTMASSPAAHACGCQGSRHAGPPCNMPICRPRRLCIVCGTRLCRSCGGQWPIVGCTFSLHWFCCMHLALEQQRPGAWVMQDPGAWQGGARACQARPASHVPPRGAQG